MGAGRGRKYVNVTLSQRITFEVAAELLRHLQRLSLRFHYTRPTGDTVRRVTSDCNSISTILCDAFLPVIGSVVTLVSMFLVLWRLDARMAVIAAAVAPYMAVVLGVYKDRMADASYSEHEVDGRIYEVIEQTFTAMPAVQAFGREGLNEQRFAGTTRDSISAVLTSLRAQLEFKVLLGLGTAIGTAAIFWMGATAVLSGALTLGGLVLFLSYLASVYGPIETIMYTGATVQNASGQRPPGRRDPAYGARGDGRCGCGDAGSGAGGGAL